MNKNAKYGRLGQLDKGQFLRPWKFILLDYCWTNPTLPKTKGSRELREPLIFLVPRDRIELPTRGFSVDYFVNLIFLHF